MVKTLIYESIIQNRDGDRWLVVPGLLTADAILAEYESIDIPETWDFLGRLFKFIPLENDLVIDEVNELWPNRLNLTTWKNQRDSYALQVRLVPYIKEGTLRLWEVTTGQRVTVIFTPAQPFTQQNITISTVNSIQYWAQQNRNASPTFLEVTLAPDFVVGSYSLVIAGRDAPNVNAELQFSINGFIVQTVQYDSASLVEFESTILSSFTFRPNMRIRVDITTATTDRGLLKFIKLVPTP